MTNSNLKKTSTTYDLKDLENILDAIPDPILAKDENDICIYANDAFCKLVNITKDNIIGYNFFNNSSYNNLYIENDITDSNKKKPGFFEKKIVINGQEHYFEIFETSLDKNSNNSKYIMYFYKEISLYKNINNTLRNEINKNVENLIAFDNKTHNLLFNDSINMDLSYENFIDLNFNNKTFKEKILEILNSASILLQSNAIHMFLYNSDTNKLNLYIDTNKNYTKNIPIATSYTLNKSMENTFLKDPVCKKDKEFNKNNFFYINNCKINNSKIYIRTFPIYYDSTLLGLINIYHAEDKYILFSQKDSIEKLCDKISIIFLNRIIGSRFKYLAKRRNSLEEELSLILETAADIWIVVDYDGTFINVNKQFESSLGWNISELKLIKYQDLIHPDDYENSLEMRNNAGNLKNYKGSGLINRYKCKDGSYKYLDWKWNYIESNNSIILTASDISEKIKLQNEKLELEKKVEMENLKTDFFANISHEFGTPLNIILTTIQLITVHFENCCILNCKDKMLEYSKVIKQNSYRLLKLVNNLLNLTKIDEGYLELNLVQCNIINFIEDIVLSVADHIGNKNRNIIFDTTEEEITAFCDPDKIETIILNLLSNAVKFTDINGLIQVNLSLNKNHDKLIVSVKDDGIPINEKDSEIIFERFTQTDNLLNRRCEGSGLGLAMVKSYVNLHKGDVWVNTDFKDGAEIIFTIPLIEYKNINSNNIFSKILDSNIERYNIEFSDIYNI